MYFEKGKVGLSIIMLKVMKKKAIGEIKLIEYKVISGNRFVKEKTHNINFSICLSYNFLLTNNYKVVK